MRFPHPQTWFQWAALAVGCAAALIAWQTSDRWLPGLPESLLRSAEQKAGEEGAGHDDHGHDHADESNSLELSPQARRNIGLEVGPVALRTYDRTITVPAMIVERPGRTRIQVSAPLTGVVTDVFVTEGEVVSQGDLMFILRLTHEDVVQTQVEFLKTLEALDVEKREIARLERITAGVVAGKVILEREYEKQKLEALLKAQREALLLHGLSAAQVDGIAEGRRLLRELRVTAPIVHDETDPDHLRRHESEQDVITPVSMSPEPHQGRRLLTVQDLNVHQGQFVNAGDPLSGLADLETLFVEGRAFEQDSTEILRAASRDWPVQAVFEAGAGESQVIGGLQIQFVSNQVHPESRAFHFYVELPNVIVRDVQLPAGRRYVSWKFKPGQRLHLRVPVERWADRIVIPREAIAEEGPETYVFIQNGDHLDRVPVHVEYQDRRHAVLANDGSLYPGDLIAMTAAHQLQMALKSQSTEGGGHAHHGHMH